VLPDISGLDRAFWYRAPRRIGPVAEGDIVRVVLHGRSVRGWVVEVVEDVAGLEEPLETDIEQVHEIRKRTGCGPDPEIIELATWAAWRWAGRRRAFLSTASPDTAISARPEPRRSRVVAEPKSPATSEILGEIAPGTTAVLRLPPAADVLPAVLSAASTGAIIVVAPQIREARLLAARLRRSGLTVALVPDEWAQAAGGVDIVIGARTAAWAPCPDLAVAVVLDEHDDALQSESSPTWHARDVLAERVRRGGGRLLLVSPVPSITALEMGPTIHPPAERERRDWPTVAVVDLNQEPPWRTSLLSSRVIEELRAPDRTIVCVLNTKGRARLSACRSCRAIARCERCGAAVVTDAEGRLFCKRCDVSRPAACLECSGNSFAVLRPGVTRLREELEAAAGSAVAEIDAPEAEGARIVIGTEAALHRLNLADTVIFLDFDAELLAPRYRAAEQAMGLLIRAGRLVGPSQTNGLIIVQTHLVHHEVVRAAIAGNPEIFSSPERERRALLGLPPWSVLCEVGGRGAQEFVESLSLRASNEIAISQTDDKWLLKAASVIELCDGLQSAVRPAGSRLRIAVDPPRV